MVVAIQRAVVTGATKELDERKGPHMVARDSYLRMPLESSLVTSGGEVVAYGGSSSTKPMTGRRESREIKLHARVR